MNKSKVGVKSEKEALDFDQYSIEELKKILEIEKLMREVLTDSFEIASKRNQRGNEVECFETRSLCEKKIETICQNAEALGIPLFDALFSEQVVVELLDRVYEDNELVKANQQVGPLLGFDTLNCASKVMLLSHCGESCEGLKETLKKIPTDKFFNEEAMTKILSNPFLTSESQAFFLIYVIDHYKSGGNSGKQQPLRRTARCVYFVDPKYRESLQMHELDFFEPSDLDIILKNGLFNPPAEDMLLHFRLVRSLATYSQTLSSRSSQDTSVSEQEGTKIYKKGIFQK